MAHHSWHTFFLRRWRSGQVQTYNWLLQKPRRQVWRSIVLWNCDCIICKLPACNSHCATRGTWAMALIWWFVHWQSIPRSGQTSNCLDGGGQRGLKKSVSHRSRPLRFEKRLCLADWTSLYPLWTLTLTVPDVHEHAKYEESCHPLSFAQVMGVTHKFTVPDGSHDPFFDVYEARFQWLASSHLHSQIMLHCQSTVSLCQLGSNRQMV